MRGSKGFTLLEVLVAVAILAIALASVIKMAAGNGANLGHLRDKTLAQWVAENKLAEMQATELYLQGRQKGKSEMAGRVWHWEVEALGEAVPNLRRIAIRVKEQEDAEGWLVVLNGFLADPQLRQGTPQQPGTN